MKYIVYKTTCLVNNKIYIGVHKTANPDEFDGYIGRGLNINERWYFEHPCAPFHWAVIKYGKENFKRETLFVYDEETAAYNKEAELVTEEFIKMDNNYNVSIGGKGRPRPCKKVYRFDFQGNIIKEYDSALSASIDVDITDWNIYDAIINKRTSRKSLWSYESEIDPTLYTISDTYKYYLYNSSGDFVQEFENCQDCISFLNTNSGNLSRAIKLQNRIKGYFITTEKFDKILINVTKLSGKLNRYTLDGKYIDSFDTVADAKRKLNLKLCSISQAIKLGRQCNGFRWTRTDFPSETISL